MYAAEVTIRSEGGMSPAGTGTPALVAPVSTGVPADLYSLMADYERRLILLALQAAGGHQRRAAASLGVLPSTLSEKLRRLGLRVRSRRPRSAQPHTAQQAAGLAQFGSAIT